MERVDTLHGINYLDHLKHYEFAKSYVRPEHIVLDVSCGTGYGSDYLAQICKLVYGVDISEEVLDGCRKKYPRKNIKFLQMDAANLKFDDNHFDTICSFETIEHIQDDKKFLHELARAIKPDGTILISTPNRLKSAYLNKFHVREYSHQEFTALLKEYFKDVTLLGKRYNKLISDLDLKSGWKISLRGFLSDKIPYPLKKSIWGIIPKRIKAYLGKNLGWYLRDELSMADIIIDSKDINNCHNFIAVCSKPKNK